MKTKVIQYVFTFIVMAFSWNSQLFAVEDISNIEIDYEDWEEISVSIRDQHYGPIVISGQTKVFGASFVNNTGSEKTCDFRYAAFKDGKIVQIYDGPGYVTLDNGAMHDIKVPCYIDLAEGDYIFFPIVRYEGESKWRMLRYMSTIIKNGYWNLHVYENYPAPSSEYMNLPDNEGKGDSEYSVYHYYQNEKFRLQMKLLNNTSNILKGKIKIVWERNISKFWRGMSYSGTDVTTEWKHCASDFAYIGSTPAVNGGIPVSIDANSKLDILIEDCCLRDYYDYGMRWAPYLVAYFLPEGKEDIDSNWLLINDNTDFCFDSQHNLVTDQWNHALNYFPFSTFEGNDTGTESLVVTYVGLNFTKSNGLVTLTNVPESSFVRVVDLNGKLIQTEFSSGNKSFSFTLAAGSGLNIISLYNYDGTLVKSFKIIR